MKLKLTEMKREIDNVNNNSWRLQYSRWQKIKSVEDLNSTINQPDIIDTHGTHHTATAEQHTLFK